MSVKAESFKKETLMKFEEKYLPYFKELLKSGRENISVQEMTEKFRTDEMQLRSEMASLTGSGQLRSIYEVSKLITEIEHYLGYYNYSDVALIGWGKTGKELLKNKGFAQNGFNLSFVFDPDAKNEIRLDNTVIKPVTDLGDIAERTHLHLGIIAVAPEKAQEIADLAVQAGILAIWNVSGTTLKTPPYILIANETFGEHEDIENNNAIALSLSALNQQLKTKTGWENIDKI